MQLTTTKRIGGLALAAALFAACGGGGASPAASTPAEPGASTPAESAPAGSMAAGGGPVFVTGSSTVEPISSGVAEAF